MVLQQVGILSRPFLSGVFLVAELNDDGVLEPEELGGDVVVFRNDAGVDEDDHVWSQVHQFVEKGFLKAFDSLSDCKECVGGTSRPFFLRFGKVFGVLVVQQSRVKEGTRKVQRVPIPPRATDVFCDIMDMLHKHPPGTGGEPAQLRPVAESRHPATPTPGRDLGNPKQE